MSHVAIASANATVANAFRMYAETADQLATTAAAVVTKPKLLRKLLQHGNVPSTTRHNVLTKNIFELQAAVDAEIGARRVLDKTLNNAKEAARDALSAPDFAHYSSTLDSLRSDLPNLTKPINGASLRDADNFGDQLKLSFPVMVASGMIFGIGGGFSTAIAQDIMFNTTATGSILGALGGGGAVGAITSALTVFGVQSRSHMSKLAAQHARTPQALASTLSNAALAGSDKTVLRNSAGKNVTAQYAHELVKQSQELANRARQTRKAATYASERSSTLLSQALKDAQQAQDVAALQKSIVAQRASAARDKHDSISAAAEEITRLSVTA